MFVILNIFALAFWRIAYSISGVVYTEVVRKFNMEKISIAVEKYIKKYDGFLISILQEIQEKYNYLPEKTLKEVADKLKIPLRDVYGVATFYNAFSFTPKGKHIITICLGTACHVRGGTRIVDVLSKELGITQGQTTPDLQFTLQTVNCLGCCAIGPIVVVDGEYYGQMTPQKTLNEIKRLIRKEKQSG